MNVTRDPKEALLARWEANGDPAAYEEAYRLYEQALAANPDDPELLHAFGYLHEGRGRELIKQAITYYEKGIDAAPMWAKNHYQLIAARRHLGETHKAIDFYKARLAERPDDPLSYSYLARAYLRAQQIPEARRVVDSGLKVAPNHAHLLSVAGDVYARLDQVDEALRYWSDTLQADGSFIDVRYGRAFLLERVGRLEEAAQEWREIIAFLRENGYEIESEWPERELARVEGMLRTSE